MSFLRIVGIFDRLTGVRADQLYHINLALPLNVLQGSHNPTKLVGKMLGCGVVAGPQLVPHDSDDGTPRSRHGTLSPPICVGPVSEATRVMVVLLLRQVNPRDIWFGGDRLCP